jgi:phosphoribosyl 1,2-cyclic phosphate phosphodiesterase
MTPKSGPELIFLGTGTSHGVPMIGCDCAVCRSDDPRDRRYRTSVALRRLDDGRTVLIDTPPELRLAVIAHDVRRVDAVLLTHAHADHILGLDDLRRFNDLGQRQIPCHGDAATLERVGSIFPYALVPYELKRSDRPSISLNPLEPGRSFEACGLEIQPIPLMHGRMAVLGFRIGDLAYCTDCSAIPEGAWPLLGGLDLLVLDALRRTPHPTHFNMEQALAVVARLRPRRTLFTHITHELSHAQTSAALPAGVALAYDGQRVRIE